MKNYIVRAKSFLMFLFAFLFRSPELPKGAQLITCGIPQVNNTNVATEDPPTKKEAGEAFNKLKEMLNTYKEEGKISDDEFNKVLAEIEKNDKDPEAKKEDEKFNKYLEKLNEAIDNQNKINEKLVNQSPKDVPVTKNNWYMNALSDDEIRKYDTGDDKENAKVYNNIALGKFCNALFHKLKGTMSSEQQEFMNGINNTVTSADGGYLLPIPTMQPIFDKLSESGLFFSETTVHDIPQGTGKKRKIPTIAASGHPTLPEYTAEGAPKQVAKFTVGEIDLELKKYSRLIPYTEEMRMYAVTDLESVVRQFAETYFNAKFENALFNNDSSNLTGLAGMNTTGKVLSGTNFSSISIDTFLQVLGSSRSVDLVNAKWNMNGTAWAHVFSKKDDQGRYLLNINEINNKTLFGYPVNLSDYAQVYDGNASASTKYIYFGDLKHIHVARYNGIMIAVSDVASYVDDEDHVHHAFQDNEIVIRLEMFVDMDSAFPNRIIDIRTSAA